MNVQLDVQRGNSLEYSESVRRLVFFDFEFSRYVPTYLHSH